MVNKGRSGNWEIRTASLVRKCGTGDMKTPELMFFQCHFCNSVLTFRGYVSSTAIAIAEQSSTDGILCSL